MQSEIYGHFRRRSGQLLNEFWLLITCCPANSSRYPQKIKARIKEALWPHRATNVIHPRSDFTSYPGRWVYCYKHSRRESSSAGGITKAAEDGVRARRGAGTLSLGGEGLRTGGDKRFDHRLPGSTALG